MQISEEAAAITPEVTSSAEPVHKQSSRKGILWKWSLGITAILMTYMTWQCGSALVQGRKLASLQVRHFHEQLNAERYEDICREVDPTFAAAQSHEELIKLFTGVHKKLGNAGAEHQINIRVDANTNGTFITTYYSTEFSSGTATETFIWHKSNGSLSLVGYNVQSRALLN
jgi:hypothetical protein